MGFHISWEIFSIIMDQFTAVEALWDSLFQWVDNVLKGILDFAKQLCKIDSNLKYFVKYKLHLVQVQNNWKKSLYML
jgi:hypothetical protein